MFVENIMIKDIITLREDSKISEAIILMQKNRIRHIPVIDDNNRILGIISDRDLRDASPSILVNTEDRSYLERPVSEIMTENVITGSPLDFIEDVASSFYEYKISCLPITRNDKLLGIITESDLLKTFVELTGAQQPGSRLEVLVDNSAGMLSDLTAEIAKKGINIISIFVYPGNDEYQRLLVFRLKIMNPAELVKTLKEKGYEVAWPTF
ncbi:CBS and ACT domain-containing protein [Alkalibacter mobilis]|uniref:CBS and ACT domain-containing protein n=1 Tax=Alkalibacter mobilis TaxID=2787712 RepID=UPI0018A0063A|nr:CBS and ACT domain-containing protein [Alkalibacter mobilis]MBF7096484.1 CBS domain-containing protein [Alkalibacter mobilis]